MDYVEQFHSTASLAREWISAEEAAAFDREVETVASPYDADGTLETLIVARLTWGRILAGPR